VRRASRVLGRIERLHLDDLRKVRFSDVRIDLHESVDYLENVVDLKVLRDRRLVMSHEELVAEGLAPVKMSERFVKVRTLHRRAPLNGLIRRGFYHRLKLTDQVVNGLPAMSGLDRTLFVGTHALGHAGNLTSYDEYNDRIDRFLSVEVPPEEPASSAPPPRRADPPPRPSMRYGTTSSPTGGP